MDYFTPVCKSIEAKGVTNYGLQEIINNSDSYRALLWASLVAGLAAIILTFSQRIKSLNDTINDWQSGVQSMMVAVIILIFAWGISAITKDLNTADYLISIVSDSIHPRLFPVIVFCGLRIYKFCNRNKLGNYGNCNAYCNSNGCINFWIGKLF
ncbi:MAG: hypothetical protein H6613_12300 [Ignavibacteriales bacterium]|nr:hypothetical protein [Ignavibacteriales bacterium]